MNNLSAEAIINTWDLYKQASLKPSPRTLRRVSISEAPVMTFEPLNTCPPTRILSASGS